MPDERDRRPAPGEAEPTRTSHARAQDPAGDADGAPTRAGAADGAAGASAAPLPDSIGAYRILGRLGSGGMGEVYEAEQQSPRRRVALKVVRGGRFVDDSMVRMFRREAETLARLEHPNIAAIYESGRTEDGQHFFAMELVRGETLDAHLAHRPPPQSAGELESRLALFHKIGDAVHYAHQRGVIHRDLKPSNVIVAERAPSPDSVSGTARLPAIKILDFGLARITDGDVQAASVATEVGMIKGTLSYMSPEQSRGDPAEIDVRTDVYALGVILYEMIAGRRPYELGEKTLIESLRVIGEQPPAPLGRAWTGGRKPDPDLETIVGKALEKDKERRYASAATLAEDIERYLTSQPILARPPSAWYQARKFAARNRVLVAGAAATLLALVAGAVVSTVFGLREASQRRAVERARADLESVVEFQGRMLEQVSPEATGVGITRAMRDVLAGALESRGRSAREIDGALAALDAATRDANTTDVARRVLHENVLAPAAAAAAEEFGSQPAIEARLLETLAVTYRSLGMSARAEPHARRVVELRERLRGPDHADTLRSSLLLGRVLTDLGRLEDARAMHESDLATLRRVAGADDPLTLDAATDLAGVEWRLGRFDDTEALLVETLPKQRDALGADHPATLASLNMLAATYSKLGRAAEAEPLYAEVVERRTRTQGEDHDRTIAALNNLANARLDLGRIGEAETLFREALDRWSRLHGEAHPRTVQAMHNLARVAQRRGALSEAENLYRQVVALRERLQGPDHPHTLEALNGLGVFLTSSGRLEEADALFRDLGPRAERALGRDSVDRATYVHSHGELLLAAGELERAAGRLRDALEVYERHGSAHTGLAWQQLGIIAARQGDRSRAVHALRTARDHGFPPERLLGDPAFASYRDDPEFMALATPAGPPDSER